MTNRLTVNNRNIMEPKDESEHVYFDASKFNNTDNIAPCIFQENLPYQIVKNPSLYNVTVARFSLPMDSLPLFRFQDNTYYVTCISGGKSGTVNKEAVVFPRTKAASDPTRDYIYNVYEFLTYLNTAIQNCITANGGLAGENAFVDYNDVAGVMTLYATAGFINQNNSLCFNDELAVKFTTFDWVYFKGGYYIGANPDGVYSTWRFNIRARSTNVVDSIIPYGAVTGTTGPYVTNNGDGYDIGGMLDFSRLVCATNLPVQNEATVNSQNSGKMDFVPSITDFVISSTTPNSLVGDATYQAQLYRLIPLVGGVPIQSISLQWYLRGRAGQLEPLYLFPYANASIKLLFLAKDRSS